MTKVSRFHSRTGLALVAIVAAASGVGACGGSGANDSGNGSDSGNDSGNGSGNDGETVLINVNPIPGGGANAAPLHPGCGPETAQECLGPGGECSTSAGFGSGGQVKDAGTVCFYGEGIEDPSATVEH